MINDIKKTRELVDKKETEKMFDVIHKNAQESRDNYIMTKNVRTIKKERKERNKKVILSLAISLLFIGVITSFFAYENKQNDSCETLGHSRDWCIVNG